MACPHFAPAKALETGRFTTQFPLPLGEAHLGCCMAEAFTPFQPGERDLLDSCNLGYARARCSRVSPDGPDCARFAVSSDTGTSISIRWVQEKEYLPYRHGTAEFVLSSGVLIPAPDEETLALQLRAYVSSYLRRTRR
jgi:hypothetical protein